MKTPLVTLALALAFTGVIQLTAAVDFHDHIGIQMWSLRDQTKADLPAALDLVKNYGLTEVETAGTGGLSVEDFGKLLTERGLKAASAHIGYDDLKKDLPAAIRTAKALGVKYVVTASLPHASTGITAQEAHEAAANFNKFGEAFRAEGISYGYHFHGFEFAPLTGEKGASCFDIIVRETKPELVCFEMDVFWVVHAGQDPVQLLKQHAGRWTMMHVKDMRKGAVTGLSTGHAAPVDNVAVGSGQMDWNAILKTAQDVGVKHYFIEDETPTPLACIPDSLKYLHALKL
jgi:sugar phosphate isomerase/epimerase